MFQRAPAAGDMKVSLKSGGWVKDPASCLETSMSNTKNSLSASCSLPNCATTSASRRRGRSDLPPYCASSGPVPTRASISPNCRVKASRVALRASQR